MKNEMGNQYLWDTRVWAEGGLEVFIIEAPAIHVLLCTINET